MSRLVLYRDFISARCWVAGSGIRMHAPREGNKHLKATTSHLDISMCASNLISRLAAVVETMVESEG